MIKIVMKAQPRFRTYWFNIESGKSKLVCGGEYTTKSSAMRAAKAWQKKIPGSVIVDD